MIAWTFKLALTLSAIIRNKWVERAGVLDL